MLTTSNLAQLKRGQEALVVQVQEQGEGDPIARRLRELGFVPGETVRLQAHGPIGREPLLVRVGMTRFALRRAEAQRVLVKLGESQ